jgi:C-lobe and N-lobe beta barrels of Tf-binding protein B
MRFRFARPIEVIALAGVVLAAGCAGGGGGSLNPSVPTGTPTTGGPSPPTGGTGGGGTSGGPDITQPSDYDSGFTGSVAASAPASFGPTPAPAQIATEGGESFPPPVLPGGPLPNKPYPSNTTFPILFTALQQSSTGLSAAGTSQSGAVTVTVGGYSAQYHLVIPSLNLDVTFSCCDEYGLFDAFAGSYVSLGAWGNKLGSSGAVTRGSAHGVPASEGLYLYGYETPANAVPTTGSAHLAGWAFVNVFAPVNGHILESDLGNGAIQGNAALSVDFASGNITGAFTNMRTATTSGPLQFVPWNDVSVTASIAAGTSKFSGTTAVTSAPQNTFSLSASATGHIDGGFYGPAAENLGAIWTLSDGTKSAIGGVVAGR